jgi:DNA-binding transcriptional MocR family regulator
MAVRLINFRSGYPNPRELPRELVARACAALGVRALAGHVELSYGSEGGSPRYLRALAEFLSAAEPSAPARQSWLFATCGCSHGLELLGSVLCQPGDLVVCEAPTYYLAGKIFADLHLRIAQLPSDGDGLRVDALARAIEEQGLRPRVVYTVSAHSNPSGATLSHARRLRLARLAAQHGFWVLSDEAYQLLHWAKGGPLNRASSRSEPLDAAAALVEASGKGADAGVQPSLRAQQLPSRAPAPLTLPPRLATYNLAYTTAEGAAAADQADGDVRGGGLISVGTWAKAMSPGIRAGWIEAPPNVVRALCRRGYVFSGAGTAGISAELVTEAILNGDAAAHLHALCAAYEQRCGALVRALRASAVSFAVVEPSGGYFVWIRLPDWAVDSDALEPFATEAGVSFLPGRQCSAIARADQHGGAQADSDGGDASSATVLDSAPGGELERYLRLCFTSLEVPDIDEGVARLARAVLAASSGARDGGDAGAAIAR